MKNCQVSKWRWIPDKNVSCPITMAYGTACFLAERVGRWGAVFVESAAAGLPCLSLAKRNYFIAKESVHGGRGWERVIVDTRFETLLSSVPGWGHFSAPFHAVRLQHPGEDGPVFTRWLPLCKSQEPCGRLPPPPSPDPWGDVLLPHHFWCSTTLMPLLVLYHSYAVPQLIKTIYYGYL